MSDNQMFEQALLWIDKNINRTKEEWRLQLQNCPTPILEYIADHLFTKHSTEIVLAAQEAIAERILLEKL